MLGYEYSTSRYTLQVQKLSLTILELEGKWLLYYRQRCLCRRRRRRSRDPKDAVSEDG